MILTDAILLGAGSGTRFSQSAGSSKQLPKQFQLLEGSPVFIWALRSLVENLKLRRVVIVLSKEHLSIAKNLVQQYFPFPNSTQIEFVTGGDRRQDSSKLGMAALNVVVPPPEVVLIHDACRPFIGPGILNALKEKIQTGVLTGCIPVIPVTETLKKVRHNKILETIDRSTVFRVQTPQLFNFSLLSHLFTQLESQNHLQFTDDASILEYFGHEVHTFSGDERNIKLTYEFESEIVQSYLKNHGRKNPCESETVMTSTV
jgi:2-C-methyl-D-erythritol 4-phosphate cytidylyltransferase/2-C-methyl-D-erythritol 2,4-cyclodiphosphate synthase